MEPQTGLGRLAASPSGKFGHDRTHCFLGVDVGTSGCRALAITAEGLPVAEARAPLPAPLREGVRGVSQDPRFWWTAVAGVLRDLAGRLGVYRPVALGIDGTSSTLLLCAADGRPLGPALLYSDARAQAEALEVGRCAPPDSPARGGSASLAKALYLARRQPLPPDSWALHQADWLLGRLTGCFGISDWNNALKLGYDPSREVWPEWLARLDLGFRLPRVVAPGTPVGVLVAEAAQATGLPPGLAVVAGTTDSTAAVLATGIRQAGEAVTCLGSTLVLKVLSPVAVVAPEYGVYSQRLGRLWLVGGASNSGGAVLRRFFDDRRMAALETRLRPKVPTGLDYYPLLSPGERFPVADPAWSPRLSPRPRDPARFFQGLLEGIAAIEARGYRRLQALGAPAPTAVCSIGGGARNRAWQEIRQRQLGVPVTAAAIQEAAYGTALLARGACFPG